MSAMKTPSWWLGLFTSFVVLVLSVSVLTMNYFEYGLYNDQVKMSGVQQALWWLLAAYGLFRLITVVKNR